MRTDDRTPPIDIGDLQRQLTAAMAAHEEASREESAARSKLTDATNRLNAVQKALDEAIEKLRGNAPWNTNWHSKRNPGHPVTRLPPTVNLNWRSNEHRRFDQRRANRQQCDAASVPSLG